MPVTVTARRRLRPAGDIEEHTTKGATFREAWKAQHEGGYQVLSARIEYGGGKARSRGTSQKTNKKARRRKSPRSQAPEGSAGDE